MQQYRDVVLSPLGRPIPGATITVTLAAGGAATLYSGDGTGALGSNVLTSDANGEYTFYAANGRYTLTIAAGGYATTTRDVVMWDHADLASTATGKGDALVGVKLVAAGSAARTQHDKNADVINVLDFGANTVPGTTDMTAAFQAAAAYAYTMTQTFSDVDVQVHGGCTIEVPAGRYLLSGTVVLEVGVSMRGAGKTATVLINTATDGPIIRSGLGIVYNVFGLNISDLAIIGSRALTSQWGLDLLRPVHCTYKNIYIENCGGGGVRVRQGVSNTFDQVDVRLCVGPGFLTGEGIDTWANPVTTVNHWPCNANTFHNCHGVRNDGAGVKLGPYTNGHVFYNCVFENNYLTAGNNVGYNIELVNTGSFMVNEFIDCWVEGPTQSHVYQNASSVTNRIVRLHHFGNGAAGNVDRAVIAKAGTVIIESPYGHGSSYKSISGSIAPFRLDKSTTGLIFLINPSGATIGDAGPWVEDEAYATSGGFYNYLKSEVFNHRFGDQVFTTEASGANASFYEAGETYARCVIDTFSKQIKFGAGSAAATGVLPAGVGAVLSSATNPVAITHGVHHVSGTSAIVNFGLPFSGFTGSVVIVPDAAFTTTTAGNIGLASTGVIGKAMVITYDGTKWWPSY